MKNSGKQFEELFKESCLIQGISCTRLKDAGWQGESTDRRFTVTNICDFICYSGSLNYDNERKLYFLELKTGKDRITFDRLKQSDRLSKKFLENSKLHETGYIFELDTKGVKKYWFIDTCDLLALQEVIEKKSFNYNDLLDFQYGREIDTYIPTRKRKPRLDMRWL